MSRTALLFLATVLLIVAALIPKHRTRNRLKSLAELKLQSRRPLTAREEQMFFRLTETLTEYTVFPQMPLAALLTTADRNDRNRFDRKIADFLICTKSLTPIAVIELDDSTHDSKIAKDADRDAMLKNAGYHTIRYRDFPTPIQLQRDIEAVLTKTQQVVVAKRHNN